MGQSIADRRQREAKDVRNNARRLAFALNMAS
jgi:hypothetical protein